MPKVYSNSGADASRDQSEGRDERPAPHPLSRPGDRRAARRPLPATRIADLAARTARDLLVATSATGPSAPPAAATQLACRAEGVVIRPLPLSTPAGRKQGPQRPVAGSSFVDEEAMLGRASWRGTESPYPPSLRRRSSAVVVRRCRAGCWCDSAGRVCAMRESNPRALPSRHQEPANRHATLGQLPPWRSLSPV